MNKSDEIRPDTHIKEPSCQLNYDHELFWHLFTENMTQEEFTLNFRENVNKKYFGNVVYASLDSKSSQGDQTDLKLPTVRQIQDYLETTKVICTEQRKLTCFLCLLDFQNRSNLIRHNKLVHDRDRTNKQVLGRFLGEAEISLDLTNTSSIRSSSLQC
jgi:hypothetical protein